MGMWDQLEPCEAGQASNSLESLLQFALRDAHFEAGQHHHHPWFAATMQNEREGSRPAASSSVVQLRTCSLILGHAGNQFGKGFSKISDNGGKIMEKDESAKM